ncbi:Carboxylesterase NlhH [Botrimarina colliarenosi]|uniref:Carboxylesterase NlhH n=1 Tax=Botrimarina colliarenosi TaxID=2528001 RepID=A0A5C6AHU0_9BACT|nr:alpha/beta hydrolase [Botrimarina colliarenosi]TWT99199.1 Carboxylesterase NlhH [Botrimarina colliarenosi]
MRKLLGGLGCAQVLAATSLAWLTATCSAQLRAPNYDELVYATVDSGGADRQLHLDLWLPDDAVGETPLVLWIHGGGWSGGTHDQLPVALGQMLNAGLAVASVEYRLSGEAIAPAQIHDVKGAVRFLRANAGLYGLDSENFAAWGSSAGGHLAALLATSGGVAAAEGDVGGNLDYSSSIQAAVDYYGPTDLLQMDADAAAGVGSFIEHDAPNSPESRLIGFDAPGEGIGVLRENLFNPAAPFPEKASLVSLMNPITHVSSDDPAMFIAHGDQDTSVPFQQSIRLVQALNLAGVENEFRRVVGEGHGGPLFQPVSVEAVEFLVGRLTSPIPEPSTALLLSVGMIIATQRRSGNRRP